MKTISVPTHDHVQMIDITSEVADAIRESGVREGLCVVYTPHTTAGITINENADPDVVWDLTMGLARIAPCDGGYRHCEGNSDAHLKSSLVGCSQQILVDGGAPVLGTWQGVYFCEFDGPRRRKVHIQVIGSSGA